jgi:integrase
MPEPCGLLVRIMGTLGPEVRGGGGASAPFRAPLTRRLLIAESLGRGLRALDVWAHQDARSTTGASHGFARGWVGGAPRRCADRRRCTPVHLAGRPAPAVQHLPIAGVGAGAGESRAPAGRYPCLRHSAAAALISSGASPKAVQTILGHRSAAFTLTVYGHLFDADLDDVAARLDALRQPTFSASRDHCGTVAGRGLGGCGCGGMKGAAHLRYWQWAQEDSNLRRAD